MSKIKSTAINTNVQFETGKYPYDG